MSDNTEMTPPAGGHQHQTPRPNAAQRLWLRLSVWQRVLAVCLLLGAVVGFVWLAGSVGPTAGEASQQCQARVEQRLKSPTNEIGEDRWSVAGVVDAQNSFGATVRLSYACDLAYDGDSWSARSVDVSE